jgi:hypothetical protein
MRRVLFALCLLDLASAQAGGRVAVIVHGETFRQHGHQDSRDTGEAGFSDQKQASASLVKEVRRASESSL